MRMERELALELVRVTEAAALTSARWMGLGCKEEADGAAVDAMRRMFDTVQISGTVVIGEGEIDEAPMLYIGEKVGCGGPEVDVAVEALTGLYYVERSAAYVGVFRCRLAGEPIRLSHEHEAYDWVTPDALPPEARRMACDALQFGGGTVVARLP